MKKKVLLIIGLLFFMTNVKALSFDVKLTNIEDKGNNGTIGSIEKINLDDKEIDALFQNVGDEVNFELTITNTGNRAGTLKNIKVTSSSKKVEYTNDLPTEGLAINGNDTNRVMIKAKLKEGATNGTSSSEIKITYNYEEGSCPKGEILSEDETMCLCQEGTERNENGICVKPEKEITCEKDEIYDETKKICVKKEVTPSSNPKTFDNILLILLLFILAGLALYTFLFKKFQTKKGRTTFGVITLIVTLSASMLVLVGVYGIGGLLGAVINPVSKNTEIVITVNEKVDMVETWDGTCNLDDASLTPDKIFDGGSGSSSDPYKIKTANQLACFVRSINLGTTYEGKFVKQTKNIKLNDNLNDQANTGDLSNAHLWISAGNKTENTHFDGTYDGNDKVISGLYLTENSNIPQTGDRYTGMFGYTVNATFKNMILSDIYMENTRYTGSLVGFGYKRLIIDNVKTYGRGSMEGSSAGIVSTFYGSNEADNLLKIENTENNINLTMGPGYSSSGVIHRVREMPESENPNMIFKNVSNHGILSYSGSSPSIGAGIIGDVYTNANLLVENCSNTADLIFTGSTSGSQYGGITGGVTTKKFVIRDSYNTGNFVDTRIQQSGGISGTTYSDIIEADNLYNSGNFTQNDLNLNATGYRMYFGGLFGHTGEGNFTLTNSYNTGNITGNIAYAGGLVAHHSSGQTVLIQNCYNLGNIESASYSGGLVGIFIGDIRNSFNKGNIHLFGSVRAGGIAGWGNANIYNSYNEGNILVTSKDGGQHGGLCAADCGIIKNSYNRGNIVVTNSGIDVGGITGQGAEMENVYNSGTITYLNEEKYNQILIGGITSAGLVTNGYNVGDIIINQNGNPDPMYYTPTVKVSGISAGNNVTNSVNKGKVTLKVNAPYTHEHDFVLSGITAESANGCFNAGSIVIDDSSLSTPIRSDGLPHRFFIGQISQFQRDGSNNKFNTDSNGHAIGCFGIYDSCTSNVDLDTGIYTSESTPDILSIINGDNAFEIKEGETLPTLKVFNQ